MLVSRRRAPIFFALLAFVGHGDERASREALPAQVPHAAPEAAGRHHEVVARGEGLGPWFRSIGPDRSIGRLTTAQLETLARERPDVSLRVLPDLHVATNLALPIIGVPKAEAEGRTGKGVVVGVVDSGFDVRHPSLRTREGKTRFAWLLDYTARARGVHADIEAISALPGCTPKRDDGLAIDGKSCDAGPECSGGSPCKVLVGAVYSGEDIDALIAGTGTIAGEVAPTDEEGHGTHAMSIVAGTPLADRPYRGVASEATMIGVKADGAGLTINATAVLGGVRFIFDRAEAAKMPAVVNMSLSSDFYFRDVDDEFAASLVSLARRPGRAMVASAGNSGSPGAAIHQTVTVERTTPVHVPLRAFKSGQGNVEAIVSPHLGVDIRVGLSRPTGPWVLPIPRGLTRSAIIGNTSATVFYDPPTSSGAIPLASTSALVAIQGPLGLEDNDIVLEGEGTVDLWVNGGIFEKGVREQTIGTPASHPEMIAVGASGTRESYVTVHGEPLAIRAAQFDRGGFIEQPVSAVPLPGQVAAFSGAGPGVRGIIKPDLLAPGVAVVAAATTSADAGSIFRPSLCGVLDDGGASADPECMFVDPEFAISTGTSFSAPFVTGAAALLLQENPSLTQEDVRRALQAGVHTHRTPPLYREAASVGELDVPGSLEIVRRSLAPVFNAPVAEKSWITPNAGYVLADGSRSLQVLVHLRGADGAPADGFDLDRFGIHVEIDGTRKTPRTIERQAPGMWAASFEPESTWLTRSVVVRSTFDGAEAAPPLTLKAALNPWQAAYPADAENVACSFAAAPLGQPRTALFSLLGLGLALALRRRR